jgi:hypothetical protein
MKTYKSLMGRPKKFAERTVVAFQERSFERIAAAAEPFEDRTDFIRGAVEKELGLRQSDFYDDLKRYLLANENAVDFCLDAIRDAVARRKAAILESAIKQKSRDE